MTEQIYIQIVKVIQKEIDCFINILIPMMYDLEWNYENTVIV